MTQICFVSRELAPFQRGGIGTYVAAMAPLLAEVAEVSVIVPAAFEAEHGRLLEAGDPRVDSRVNYRFLAVEQIDRYGDTDPGPDLLWSEAALGAITDLYGSAGPDLVEFCDYRGEAIAAVRARRRDPAVLRRTKIAIRAHTTLELCMVLKGAPLAAGDPMSGIERQSLRAADVLLWAGGDVLAAYRRFYGAGALPPAQRIRYPLDDRGAGASPPPGPPTPLRILFLGRFDRLKGVSELIEGFTANRSTDWLLTMIGGDTPRGPGAASMREYVLASAAGDPRITARDHLPREQLGAELAAHHLSVVPSRYEAWGYVALESLAANRPVLATPVGGLAELVDRRAGWLARACSARELERSLASLVEAPEQVVELIESGAPRERSIELTDPGPIADAYLELATSGRAPAGAAAGSGAGGDRREGTTVILAPGATTDHAREALDSILGQTTPARRILVLGGAIEDGVADDFEGLIGDSGALNARIAALDTEYLAVLGADDLLHAEYLAATMAVLDADRGSAIAHTDSAVFGPRLGDWRAAVRAPRLLPELPLPPSDALVLRSGPLGPRNAARLDIGLATLPRTTLLRTEAVITGGGLPPLGPGWDHVDLISRLLWAGWRAEYLARALVGRRLVFGAEPISEALAEAVLPRIEAIEPLVPRLERERDEARAERDWARSEIAHLSGTRWARLGKRFEPLRSLVRRD